MHVHVHVYVYTYTSIFDLQQSTVTGKFYTLQEVHECMFDLADSIYCTSYKELSSSESDSHYDLSDPEAGQVSDSMPEDPSTASDKFNRELVTLTK